MDISGVLSQNSKIYAMSRMRLETKFFWTDNLFWTNNFFYQKSLNYGEKNSNKKFFWGGGVVFLISGLGAPDPPDFFAEEIS